MAPLLDKSNWRSQILASRFQHTPRHYGDRFVDETNLKPRVYSSANFGHTCKARLVYATEHAQVLRISNLALCEEVSLLKDLGSCRVREQAVGLERRSRYKVKSERYYFLLYELLP